MVQCGETWQLKAHNYYAQQFIERVFEVVKNLEPFPELGRKIPEAEEINNVREFIFQSYRIIYLLQQDHVYIITVTHGSPDLSGLEKHWDIGLKRCNTFCYCTLQDHPAYDFPTFMVDSWWAEKNAHPTDYLDYYSYYFWITNK